MSRFVSRIALEEAIDRWIAARPGDRQLVTGTNPDGEHYARFVSYGEPTYSARSKVSRAAAEAGALERILTAEEERRNASQALAEVHASLDG